MPRILSRHIFAQPLLVLSLLLILMGLPGQISFLNALRPTASAASTFAVTDTDDSGAGSLRQAIPDANANPVSFGDGCVVPHFDGDPPHFSVGTSPRSIVTADFNHDSMIDQAVANFGSGGGSPNGSVSILINNGVGGFSSQTIPIGIDARSIVTADFNNDSRPDLAVLHYVSGSCCISTFVTVLLSNALGEFTPGSPIAVGNDAAAMTTGDFNNDGKADLAATASGSAVVLLGNGAAGFGAPTSFTVGGNLTSIVNGDVNGDTKPDLLIGNLFGFDVAVLLGNGAGGFAPALKSTTGAFIQFLAIGDFNLDSRPDVVTATTGNSVSVVLGNGNGTFGAPTQFPVPSNPRTVRVQDFNGDGRADLATANGLTNNVSVLIGNGSGGFGLATSYLAGSGPFYVSSNDFNGDGKADLTITNTFSNDVSVLNGDGAGHFLGARSLSVGTSPLFVASGDFNTDGKVDLVATNANQNSVSVLLGEGGGTFGADVKYPANFGPRDVTVNDFNEDGKLDLALVNNICCQDLQSVSILLGNGNGTVSAPTAFTGGAGAMAIVAADLNKDGHLDLATVNNSDKTISILIGNGNGTFAVPSNIDLTNNPLDLAAGDLNGDGNTDLVVAASAILVFLGNGAGGFTAEPQGPITGAFVVALGDVNGDGFADVGTASATGSVSVLLGNGSGGLSAPTNLPVASPSDVAFADFNNDGETDLAASNGTANVSVWLGDGAGVFSGPTAFTAGGNPRGVLATDVNGDQRTDLVIADLGSSTLSVLTNTCVAAPIVPPSLAINNVAVPEGDGGQATASFTVSLSASSDKTVAVSYYTTPGSAGSGVDYQSVSGRLLFAPGTTSRTLTVPINGDTLAESDELFRVHLSHSLNASLGQSTGSGNILNDDGPGLVTFSSPGYAASEGAHAIEITVQRSGNAGAVSRVDYATSDTGSNSCHIINGNASSRCDYESAIGTLTFAAGETSKAIVVLLVDDAYAEGSETFSLTLSNPSGLVVGPTSVATATISDNESTNGTNPIDQANFFVRQHYLDFLNREPDADGLAFWANQITECQQPGATCNAEVRRINVSAAFFLSIEFQETGYMVYRFYKTAYGDAVGTSNFGPPHQLPVPVVRFNEFLPDAQQIAKDVIVGEPGWEQQLSRNKIDFVFGFVLRPRFVAAYPNTMTPAEYVDKLFLNAGVTPSADERTLIISGFHGAATSADTTARARTLAIVAENSTVAAQEKNKAFVLMQYFGYLRRNPNDPQDSDYSGYDFWLTKLNEFNGNFVNAEMVKSFLVASEYRQRFGP